MKIAQIDSQEEYYAKVSIGNDIFFLEENKLDRDEQL